MKPLDKHLAFKGKLPFIIGEDSHGGVLTRHKIANLKDSQLRQGVMKYLIEEVEILDIDELTEEVLYITDFKFSTNMVPSNYIYYDFTLSTSSFAFAIELRTRFNLKIEQ